MLVVESDAYSGHYPHWAFRLGGEVYKTKDVPSRVEAIKKELLKEPRFEFIKAQSFAEKYISHFASLPSLYQEYLCIHRGRQNRRSIRIFFPVPGQTCPGA